MISAAFVLAVSTLTAAVPFIVSQAVHAVAGSTVSNINTFADFKAALNDPSVGYINLASGVTITAPEKLVLSRSDVRINGNDSAIVLATPTANVPGWNGDYVFQVYNASNVEINSLRVRGGDAGFLINGSQVILKGNTHVDGHEFGGIEVSRGSAPGLNNSQLTLQGALWSETAPFESQTKPSVWVVDGQGTVNSSALYQTLTSASYIAPGKTYYYRNAALTASVATNTTKNQAYDSVAAAIAGAAAGDTVRLDRDVALSQMVVIDKAITFDGNNKTLSASYSYTTNGVDNAVVTVTTSGVAVKNLITDNQAIGAKPHGVVVYNAQNVNLTNLTLKNGRAGLIVNGSVVTVNGIHTVNNQWYGIDVDKAGARLNIQGANTHTEAVHIFVDNLASGAFVVDLYGKYEKTVSGTVATYVWDTHAPQVTSVTYGGAALDGAVIAGTASIGATLNDGPNTAVNYTNFELRKDGMWKAQWAGGNSLNPTVASFNTTVYADGQYTLRVYGRDNAGNIFEKIVTFTIDNTVPTLNVTALPDGFATNANTLTVTGTVTDTNLAGYYYQILDSNKQPLGEPIYGGTAPVSNGTLFAADISGLEDGQYFISVWAYDAAGNSTDVNGSRFEAPYIVEFLVDRSAPAVTVGSVFTYTTGAAQVVSGTADSDATISLYVGGVLLSDTITPAADGTWSYTITPARALGVYQLSVIAQDELGNQSVSSAATRGVLTIATVPVVITTPVTDGTSSQAVGNTFAGPATINPSAQQAVLGESSQSTASNDTKSTAPAETLAAAIDANNTDGKALGLAWYWWVVIAAGIALLLWWIIAAFRKRSEA